MSLTIKQLRALDVLVQTGLDQPDATRRAWFDTLNTEPASLKPLLERALFVGTTVESGTFMGTVPKIERAAREALDLSVGDVVGPYRLERLLGEGGSASVWRAQRTDGTMKRTVALKLPYFVGNTRGWAERIERERDVLASLNHPNVATIYDAGIADNSRPWLALELINGERIDRYAQAKQLTGDALVRLFLPVVRAIEHAHARGVIHRDVKPQNILVSDNDRGEAQVKLLDFGIAKLQHEFANQNGDSELTRMHGRPFTPEYASLEQLRGETITTATDIHALGVVFYELLCGARPFDEIADHFSLRKLEQNIAAETPPKPSSRVKRMRQSSGKLIAESDLDAIALKAIHRDSEKRYQTASAFADDLERFLKRETVSARQDSGTYRATQFIKRHRFSVLASTAVIASLSVGFGVAVWQAIEADKQRAVAETQARRATDAFEESQRQRDTAAQSAQQASASAQVASEAAARSSADAKRADAEAKRAEQQTQQARIQTSRALEQQRIAERAQLAAIAAADDAKREQSRADAERVNAVTNERKSVFVRSYLMSLFGSAGSMATSRGVANGETVEQIVVRAGERIRNAVENRDGAVVEIDGLVPEVARAIKTDPAIKEELISVVAQLHDNYGLRRSSEKLWLVLLDLKSTRIAPEMEIAAIESRIGLNESHLRNPARSEAMFSRAEARFSKPLPKNQERVYASLLGNRAHAALNRNDNVTAKALSTRAISLLDRIAPISGEMVSAKAVRASTLRAGSGTSADSADAYREVVSIAKQVFGESHQLSIEYQVKLAGELLIARRHSEAREVAEAAWAAQTKSLGDTTYGASIMANTVGRLRGLTGDATGARAILEHSLAIKEKISSEVPAREFSYTRTLLIEVLLNTGQYALACGYAAKAIKDYESMSPTELRRASAVQAAMWSGVAFAGCGEYARAHALTLKGIDAFNLEDTAQQHGTHQQRVRAAWVAYRAGNTAAADTLTQQVVDFYPNLTMSESYARIQAEFFVINRLIERGDVSAIHRARTALQIVDTNKTDHPAILKSLRTQALQQLVGALIAFEMQADAEKFSRELVSFLESSHVHDSPQLANSRSQLALILGKQGKMLEAQTLHDAAATVLANPDKHVAPHFQTSYASLIKNFPTMRREARAAAR